MAAAVVVVVMMLVVVVMVVMTTGDMIVMLMHGKISFTIFLLLYRWRQGLSKHLFFAPYPPGGLAPPEKKDYNRRNYRKQVTVHV